MQHMITKCQSRFHLTFVELTSSRIPQPTRSGTHWTTNESGGQACLTNLRLVVTWVNVRLGLVHYLIDSLTTDQAPQSIGKWSECKSDGHVKSSVSFCFVLFKAEHLNCNFFFKGLLQVHVSQSSTVADHWWRQSTAFGSNWWVVCFDFSRLSNEMSSSEV